jgi:hypothetical protein
VKHNPPKFDEDDIQDEVGEGFMEEEIAEIDDFYGESASHKEPKKIAIEEDKGDEDLSEDEMDLDYS